MNQFEVGDIIINKKPSQYEDKSQFHYVIVDTDDTYTYITRIDDTHRSVRYPTVNMDWFFNVVSRGSEE